MKKFMLRRDTSSPAVTQTTTKKKDKDEFVPPPPSALESMLARAGPVREDGSDKYFGMENPQFGNTCYCNSIIQSLYHSRLFREAVINYPCRAPADALNNALAASFTYPTPESIREDLAPPPPKDLKQNPNAAAATNASSRSAGVRPNDQQKEDKESSEYKKRVAMATLPIFDSKNNSASYGMDESLFTAVKDAFESIAASKERTAVFKPNHILDVLRRDYEMFRTTMHQDAHEFLNILLNEVVNNVEADAARSHSSDSDLHSHRSGSDQSHGSAASAPVVRRGSHAGATTGAGARWVHELFEGILTSETQCLTCEKKSQRDEVFLDLSVDLEQHSSVTHCLRKFSAEEMLCERDKFHCDNCGGLQEAEKRMVIKRLPRILALHLKRFKYTEDLQRLQKLFHRVVYPYYLRLFNTTDDAEDPDRLYELYAVVVHIGGGPHHGHYVAIIKTQEHGWLLFDDELVEPVDKNFVRNFFGDKPGLACAYVLFYQETSMERMQAAEEMEAAREAEEGEAADLVNATVGANGDLNMSSVHKVTSWPRKDSGVAGPLFDRKKSSVGSPPPMSPTIPVPDSGIASTPISPESTREASVGMPGNGNGTGSGSSNGHPKNASPQTFGADPYAYASPAPNTSSSSRDKDKEKEKDRRKTESHTKKEQKERAREEKERRAAEKAEAERRAKMEKQRRKEAEARLKEAQKLQDAEMKAAIEASRVSKAEEERKARREEREDAQGQGQGQGLGHGLSRFKITSKSFGLSVKTHHGHGHGHHGHKEKKDKDVAPKSAHPAMDARGQGQGHTAEANDDPNRPASMFLPSLSVQSPASQQNAKNGHRAENANDEGFDAGAARFSNPTFQGTGSQLQHVLSRQVSPTSPDPAVQGGETTATTQTPTQTQTQTYSQRAASGPNPTPLAHAASFSSFPPTNPYSPNHPRNARAASASVSYSPGAPVGIDSILHQQDPKSPQTQQQQQRPQPRSHYPGHTSHASIDAAFTPIPAPSSHHAPPLPRSNTVAHVSSASTTAAPTALPPIPVLPPSNTHTHHTHTGAGHGIRATSASFLHTSLGGGRKEGGSSGSGSGSTSVGGSVGGDEGLLSPKSPTGKRNRFSFRKKSSAH